MTQPIEVDSVLLRLAAGKVRASGTEFHAELDKAAPELAAGAADGDWAAVRAMQAAAARWQAALAELGRRTGAHAEHVTTAAASYDAADTTSSRRSRYRLGGD